MDNGLGVKAMIIPPNGTRSRFYMIQFNFSAMATLGTEEVGRCKEVLNKSQYVYGGFFAYRDVACVAGVKRGRGRGNLGAREGERSRALSPFPFPFEHLPRRLTGTEKSGHCREVAVSGGSSVYTTVKERRQFCRLYSPVFLRHGRTCQKREH